MRSICCFVVAGLLLLPPVFAQSAEDYLAQSNQLVTSYQWREAGALLAEALQKHPGHPELELKQAHLLIRTGGAAQAVPLLQRQLRLRPGDNELLRLLGEARIALGDYAAAAGFFRKALLSRPSDAQILHDLSVALLLEGDKKAALTTIEEAVRGSRPTVETKRLYALLLNLNGRIEESRRQMKEAVAQEPQNARLLFELSEARRIDGKYGEALEYVDMAIEADSENPLYYSALARLYRTFKQEPLAEEAAGKATSLLQAFDLYARALRQANQGEVREAALTLAPAVRANPEFLTGKLLLADLEERQNRPEKALLLYQEVLAQDPSRLEAIEKSAWIRSRRGELKAALELLQGSSRAVQNQILTQAYLYMTEQKWDVALEHLQRVELSYPLNHQLLKLISTCLREQGRLEEASNQLERARVLVPDDQEIAESAREIRLQQATRLIERESWREAAELFRRLATEDPDRSVYWLNLGYCRERSGDLEGAVTAYRRGLQRDSAALWAQGNLASCLTRLGRYSEALTEWEKVVDREPSGQSLLQLGLCYAQLDRNHEAEQALYSALAAGENSAELLYNLGVTKMRLLKTDEGWDYVRRSALKGYQPARDLIAKARSARR
jgi:tetratricopeptide (TPR) repeat protein